MYDVEKLRFWCQKIIPLVYDDSLSYYELLCKVVYKLNELVENVNDIPEYIGQLISQEGLQEIMKTLLVNLEKQIADANEGESETATADRVVGTLVWLNGYLYRVTKAMDTGDRYVVDSNVEKITIEECIYDAMAGITDKFEPNERNASADRETGELVWFNNGLCLVTRDIREGESYTSDNCEVTSVDEVLNAIRNSIGEVDDKIGNLDELQTESKDSVVGAINEVNGYVDDVDGKIGELSDLQTEHKDNVVEAVNEVNGNVGELGDLQTENKDNVVDAVNEVNGKIGELDDLQTEHKDNVVDAVNEIHGDISSLVNDVASVKVLNVEELVAFDASSGDYVKTLGYHTAGDGGAGVYYINSEPAELGDVQLNNELVAHLVYNPYYMNVKQFGAYGDAVHFDDDVLNAVINKAVSVGDATVFLPEGRYRIDTYLSSLRNEVIDGVDIKDLNNITIEGTGNSTVLYSENPSSLFDVIQLNQVCNVTIKNIKIYETGEVTDHGANGVSITNGGHDIVLDHVTVEPLPYYTGGGYIDGGKGFTIQWSQAPEKPISNIIIKDCVVNGSPIGFEIDVSDATTVVHNCVIEGCEFNVSYAGYVGNGAVVSNNCSVSFHNNLIKTTQRGILLSRASCIVIDNVIILQEDDITNIYPIDSDVTAIDLYSTCNSVSISNVLIRYKNGVNGLYFTGTGGASDCAFTNIVASGAFSNFFVIGASGATLPTKCRFNHISAYGVPGVIHPSLYGDNTLKNDYINYDGKNIINSNIWTGNVVVRSVGTYGNVSLPVYSMSGSLLGYIPIYND